VAGPHQQRVAVVVASDKPSVRYGPALLGDPLWLPESRLVLYRASSGSEEPGDLMALDTDTGASRRLLGQVADFVPCAGSAWVIHTRADGARELGLLAIGSGSFRLVAASTDG
jgi:hypothetical protein